MTEVFGVKKVYGFCLLATAGLSLLSPVAAKLHVAAFIAVRVVQGGICHFWILKLHLIKLLFGQHSRSLAWWAQKQDV